MASAAAQCIRDAGGRVLIQDEASSVVWGMPGAMAQAGLADRIVPLDGIADEIIRETQSARAVSSCYESRTSRGPQDNTRSDKGRYLIP